MNDKDYRSLRAEMALDWVKREEYQTAIKKAFWARTGWDGLKDDICDMLRAGALEGVSEETFRRLAEMVGFEEEKP